MAMNIYQPHFSGGELSPNILGQVTYPKYAVGAEKIENFIIEEVGCLTNRPGMYFLGETTNKGEARLIKFEYSEAVQYLLEFGEGYMSVWNAGARMATVTSPFTLDEVRQLKYAQSADYMFLCCGAKPPYKLIRKSVFEWEFQIFEARLGPFDSWNLEDIGIRVTQDNPSGAVPLESDSPVFDKMEVGQLLKLRHYVPRQNIGENLSPGEPFPPDAVIIPAGTVLIDNVTPVSAAQTGIWKIQTSGYWTGSVMAQISTGSATLTITGTGDGTYQSNSDTDDFSTSSVIKVTAATQITVTGKKDNQFSVNLTTPSSSDTYYSPSLTDGPMKEKDNPTIIPAGTDLFQRLGLEPIYVYGAWSFTTTGVWKGDFSIQRSTDIGGTWNTIAQKGSDYNSNASFSGVEEDSGVMYRIITTEGITVEKEDYQSCDYRFTFGDVVRIGIVKISAITDPTHAVGDVQEQMGSTDFTKDWAAGAWIIGNYPKVVTFYQDRLIFANTPADPQTLWASKTGDYENFGISNPIQDDDSINVTLSGSTVNEIRDMIPIADLMLMTNSTEYILRGDQVFSPLSIFARPQGFRGSYGISPLIIGNTVVFCVKDGRTLRDFSYSLESDGYNGNNLSVLAQHIFKDEYISDMDYQQNPNSIIWVLGADGTLASLTYVREQDIWGWATHTTDGTIVNICVVYDYVYFIVLRDGKYYIEYLVNNDENIYLDSAIHGRFGDAVSSVWGLDHLANKEAGIYADGFDLGIQTVIYDPVSQQWGIPVLDTQFPKRKFNEVVVGLPYKAALKMLPLVPETAQGGVAVTKKKRVAKVFVRVDESRSFRVGANINNLQDMIKRDPDMPAGEAMPPRTGFEPANIESGFDYYGSIYIIQDRPFPLRILGVDRIFEVGNEI